MRKLHAISITMLALSMPIMHNAYAQYVWLNEKGAKQFSDQPPPKNTPRDKILKSPGNRLQAIEPATNDANNVNAGSKGEKSEIEKLQKPQTVASKNEEFNKRRIAKEEADKKADNDKQAAQDKERNCARAKSYQQTIESGMIIASRDQNGERTILDEGQRTRELTEAKKIIASECK